MNELLCLDSGITLLTLLAIMLNVFEAAC